MGEENISHEFRLKNIEEINNCFIKEIDQNELMSNKHKMVGTTFNYTENFNNLDLEILGIKSPAVGNKHNKKHDKIVLLAKPKINSIKA